VRTNTGTNSYQFLTTNGIPGMTNAHALTITHAGLVYGGDLDSNNPVGTNYGFDAYNVYFSNIASSLGIATTTNVPYINQIITTNRTVPPPTTNFFATNTATIANLTIPNTNSSLFPQPHQTVMQPVLLINHGLTTPGFPSYTPNFKIRIRGLKQPHRRWTGALLQRRVWSALHQLGPRCRPVGCRVSRHRPRPVRDLP